MLFPFNPAIEMRPSAVMYTCAFSARALVWGGVRPVKLFQFWSAKKANTRRLDKLPEHAYLALDVAPFARSVEVFLESGVKLFSHADDTVSHSFHLRLPLGVKIGVTQNGIGNSGTVERGIRVHGSDDDLQLAVDARLLSWVRSGEGEGTNALSVQAHVLSERLGQSNLVALGNKMTDGKGVLDGGARGEALIGHVEEREKFPLLHNVGNFSPLFRGRINTSRVVGTSVEQDYSLLWSCLRLENIRAKNRIIEEGAKP